MTKEITRSLFKAAREGLTETCKELLELLKEHGAEDNF